MTKQFIQIVSSTLLRGSNLKQFKLDCVSNQHWYWMSCVAYTWWNAVIKQLDCFIIGKGASEAFQQGIYPWQCRHMCMLARSAFCSHKLLLYQLWTVTPQYIAELGIGWTNWKLVACQVWCWSPEYTAALLRRKPTLLVDATVKAYQPSSLILPI